MTNKLYISNIFKGFAILALVFGLSGVAGASSAADIYNTGPGSENEIEYENVVEYRQRNNNDVRVENRNPQTSSTGDSTVRRNTTGGNAETGDALNDSLLTADIMVDNENCGCEGLVDSGDLVAPAVIEQTGPDSKNEIEFANDVSTRVTNRNRVELRNYNTQDATSGDARVANNTTGGDASTGDASNVSTVDFVVHVVN